MRTPRLLTTSVTVLALSLVAAGGAGAVDRHMTDATAGSFTATSARTTTDAWSAGYAQAADTTITPFTRDGDGGTIIEHWDGQSRSLTTSADGANPFHASLQGVSALSAKNVWGAGFYYDETGAAVTLVEHWNGKKWKVVPTPHTAGAGSNYLFGVSMLSATDVWSAGVSFVSADIPFMQHRDGDAWSMVPVE